MYKMESTGKNWDDIWMIHSGDADKKTRPSSTELNRMRTLYDTIQGAQNLCPPSRAEGRQASVKLTISPSNTFNLNGGRQKLPPKTI